MWWITAADSPQVEARLAGLAGRLCPVVAVAGTTADAAGWATGWLQSHDGWLRPWVRDRRAGPGTDMHSVTYFLRSRRLRRQAQAAARAQVPNQAQAQGALKGGIA
ncbi:MAG TPA: hypothetical protein VH478_17095 [Trebonia sp.]|nr:hypothetical protein [Trebonia sp.]